MHLLGVRSSKVQGWDALWVVRSAAALRKGGLMGKESAIGTYDKEGLREKKAERERHLRTGWVLKLSTALLSPSPLPLMADILTSYVVSGFSPTIVIKLRPDLDRFRAAIKYQT